MRALCLPPAESRHRRPWAWLPPGLLGNCTPAEQVTLGYLIAIALLVAAFRTRVPAWGVFVALHALGITGLLALIQGAHVTKHPGVRAARDWHPVLFIPPLFHELSYLIHAVHPTDFDGVLIALDRWLFGVDPVLWLQQFASPWLTEWLQLAYTSFYFFPVILGIPLYRAGRLREFRHAQLGIVLTFYLSYLGYFLVPALGPRFAQQSLREIPLDGLYLATPIRQLLDRFEMAPFTRDAFPSGHVAIALMVQYYAWRYVPGLARWLLPVTASLLVSTVYLRYHYVVDVLAGVVLAGLCLALARRLDREPA
ncbi:MAG: inositol phosphorylceramide synthase [Deltaproteobacteria bacterium]|nr:inositol phosphorylceramide synthase [Deltaproteobacteria bacterium]MBI3075418.1 inositol phosphorylceramide synthase [Deltaproteobacteria bacterium]